MLTHQQVGWTTAVANAFVGYTRQLFVDITKKEIRLSDGVTTGGIPMGRADLQNIDNAVFKAKGNAADLAYKDLSNVATSVFYAKNEPYFKFGTNEIVVNEDSGVIDFRVETASNADAFLVDADADKVICSVSFSVDVIAEKTAATGVTIDGLLIKDGVLPSVVATTTRPTHIQVGGMWIDNNTTPWTVYQFDGADNVKIGELDATANSYTPFKGASAVASLAANTFTGAQNYNGQELQTPKVKAARATTVTTTAPGAAYNIDFNAANVYDITLDDDTVFSFTNLPAAQTFGGVLVIIRQPAGANYAPSFPAATEWDNGDVYSATATNAAYDKLFFDVVDATVVNGVIVGQDYQ
jgi:hypothetical protein